jgi:hypothetical protein
VLGDIVDVTVEVDVPDGQTAVVVDTLPSNLEYVIGSSEVNGSPMEPMISGNELSYSLGADLYEITYSVKIVEATAYEETEAENDVVATFSVPGMDPYSKDDSALLYVCAFEELHKNVGFPKADIMFAVDLTGSMRGEITTIKTETQAIIEAIKASVGDAEFGLITFMDYDGSYSTTEAGSDPVTYTATYGSAASGDYPYMLDQDLTDNEATIDAAIQAMAAKSGGDGPQDYSRIIYESYADTNIDWRTGSTKFLIMFGDNVPHDTNFDIDNDGTLENRGGDPGRNGTLGDSDDLDFETVVAAAASDDVRIIGVYSGSTGTKYPWTYMADETGGQYFELENAEDIPEAINDMLKAEAEETLTITESTETQWAVVIDVTNTYGYTMEDVVVKDRFGAEIEIDEVLEITDGTYTETTKGKSAKVFLTWDIGDLPDGETARLALLVSTDLNPAGKQEYSSPGTYELNSGATLKFIDPDGTQLSAYTDSIYVTVLPE